MEEKEIRNPLTLVVLHLLPGALLPPLYLLFLHSGILTGYPKLIVLALSALLTIVPFQLGFLWFTAKKEHASYQLLNIIGLKSNLRTREYVLYCASLFVLTGLLFTLLQPVSDFFLQQCGRWLPGSWLYMENLSLFSRKVILTAAALSFFVFTLIVPVTEELYFRGFLLARMKWMGKYAVLVHVLLFALYHFWSPWLIVTRIVAMLPLYYVVYRKDSVRLAILVHCLLNFTDTVALLALL